MDASLYRAALYLNLRIFFFIKKKNDDAYVGELRGCLIDVFLKIVKDTR